MNRKDRRGAAKTGGISTAGSPADALFSVAMAHHNQGRFQDAQRIYQEILARDPRHTGALTYSGILCFQGGQHQAAVTLLQKAAAVDRSNPAVHFSLGLVYATLGRNEEAIASNLRALKLKPDHVGAHTNLGALLMRRGAVTEARQHLAKALQLDPADPACYENYAVALFYAGEAASALEVAAKGLGIAATAELRATFLRALPALEFIAPSTRQAYRPVLLRAIEESWYRPSALAPAIVQLMSDDPAAWPQDQLWRALIQIAPNVNPAIERQLTAWRRAALKAAGAGTSEHDLAFTCALAQQCFLNEYVFDLTADEPDEADALRLGIEEDLAGGRDISAAALATLACYMPLHLLPRAEDLAVRIWPALLQPVIAQQVAEPLREQQLRSAIETLTPVDDAVSVEVQRQYEENAYPRWTRTFATPAAPPSFDAYIQGYFPGSAYRGLGNKKVDVLVAGCGTGRQVVEIFGRYAASHVTAVDLSRASLAYAARKAEQAGLRNIRFAQADVLNLDAQLGAFDVIESTGVLHHLGDPLEGWRRLLALLRPGGLMLVALYSAAARSHVRAARAFIAEHGYEATPDGIRRFRQAALALPPTHPVQPVSHSPDFFTISECRDYLFHVQEHQFSLPEISGFLRDQGLTFLGFETTARQAYLRRFPADPAAIDLNNWHQFETDHPATFAGMYPFWIQKPL